jgi:hypothetical protein
LEEKGEKMVEYIPLADDLGYVHDNRSQSGWGVYAEDTINGAPCKLQKSPADSIHQKISKNKQELKYLSCTVTGP